MEKKNIFYSILPGIIFIFLLWIIFLLDYLFSLNLWNLGLMPRDFKGLRGIIFMPLVHGGARHLINNSFPLLILLGFLSHFYKNHFFRVTILIWIISGLWTWTFARTSYHIGASAIVYGLASFIFFAGIIIKEKTHIAVSLLVVFIYGSLVWGVLPIDYTQSWEGHLSGFLAGIAIAYYFKTELKLNYMKTKSEDETEDDDEFDDFDFMDGADSEIDKNATPWKRYGGF